MFCRKCGNQVADGAAFCPKCGNPMPQQAPQPQSHQQPQPKPQQTYPQQTSYQQQQPETRKKRRWPIVVAISVVAAAAIAAVVVFVVLPRVMPRGIWVLSKSTDVENSADDSRTNTFIGTFDDKGHLTHQTLEYTSEGSLDKHECDYTYSEDGFCKSESEKSSYKSSSSGGTSNNNDDSYYNYDYQWEFGADGKPTKLVRTQTMDGKTYTQTHEYEYNGNGNISKETLILKGESYENEYVSEYNDRGLLVKYVDNDEEGGASETVYAYECDASGKPTKVSSTTTDKATGKKTREGTEILKYDENGNPKTIKTEYIDCSANDSEPSKTTSTGTFEYTYIENPSPWVVQIAHLYTVPRADPY